MASALAIQALDSTDVLTQTADQKVLMHHLTHRIMFLPSVIAVSGNAAYVDRQVNATEELR